MGVAKKQNAELGIEATVFQIGVARFSVTLRDTDADEYLPQVKIFNNLESAEAYAETLVFGVSIIHADLFNEVRA